MLTLIEALRFRSLRYVRQPLGRLHVLLGPNASGKTTFLDVIAFLGAVVSNGPGAAVTERTQNFQDLTWNRSGEDFELAVEAKIPEERRPQLGKTYDFVRYEVKIGQDPATLETGILAENLLLKSTQEEPPEQLSVFPRAIDPPTTIMAPSRLPATKGLRLVISKASGGNDNWYSEVEENPGKGWIPSIRLGPRKSALANVPAEEEKFPVATWLRDLLAQGVQSIVLNSMLIRKASPPLKPRGFLPDGSNLPWVVAELEKNAPEKFMQWIEHIRTALPQVEGIRTVLRDDDRHRYLVIRYQGGLEVPSWVVSDGTLRLLALTIPAYLQDFRGVYLIEEPENGIHPAAVETVYRSLSSAYDAQILLATHSPVILSLAGVDDILCFAKSDAGATDIVRGTEHPALRDWKGTPNLDILFGSGILG